MEKFLSKELSCVITDQPTASQRSASQRKETMNLALSGTRGVSISKSAMYLKRLPYELRTHRSWIVVPWDAFKWNPIEPRMRQLQLTYINLTVTVLAKTILRPLRWCDLGLKNRVSSSRQHRLRGAETEIMSVIFSVFIQGNENMCARFVFISYPKMF